MCKLQPTPLGSLQQVSMPTRRVAIARLATHAARERRGGGGRYFRNGRRAGVPAAGEGVGACGSAGGVLGDARRRGR